MEVRKGTAKGEASQLNLNGQFYVGGVADFSSVSEMVGFSKGFIGCLGYIMVNGQYVNLGKCLSCNKKSIVRMFCCMSSNVSLC